MLGITICMLALFTVFSAQIVVNAELEVQDVDSVITINEDDLISNTNFFISDSCSTGMVFNVVSGTLTLDGCNITTTSTGLFTCVFKVGSEAKLILKNTTFTNIDYIKAIDNSGVVEIDNVTFMTGRTSIENNGSYEVDSIKYYSGNLEKVTLNSGYISVYENTKVQSAVTVSITNFNNLILAVKGVGDNVFASKYIDKFVYKDNTKISEDNDYYFDYIGDFDNSANEIKDASGKVVLNPGDIVLTTMSYAVSNDDTIYYAPKYCSSYKFFKNEFEKKSEEGSYQMKLYKSNGLGRTLDNYSANMSSAVFREVSSASGNLVSLSVNCVLRGDNAQTFSSYQIDYLSGSNYAIFVDIPEGYEYDSVEFLKGSTSAEDTFGVLDGEVYANGCYIRPIIEYKATTYGAHTVTANFIVKEKVSYANVELVSEASVTLSASTTMVVGSNYTFSLKCAENEIISAIQFNGNCVDFEYDEQNSLYTFEAEVLENNTIAVETKTILNITPNPERVEFEYGDEVELKETYKISETESIDIEYVASEMEDRGTYSISEVKAVSSEKYQVVVTGDRTYSIVKKKITLSEIATKTHTVAYTENLNLDESNFLVNALPAYLSVELTSIDEFVGGEQSIRLEFSVTNENYTIVGDDYISVTLVVLPKTISTTDIVFNNSSAEYTGSNIEVFATNYDANVISVIYTYYQSSDLENPIQQAVNVGSYIVKAVYSSKSSLYTVSGEKSITLTITPKQIDMTEYLQSIEVTEFTYDGQGKSINLKRDTLPAGVVISEVVVEDSQVDADIYYFDIYFETTSSNYSCVSEKRVALVINPIIVTLILETSEYSYTGKAPTLAVNLTNVIAGDIVNPVYESAIASSVGEHTVRVLKLSNTNYALASAVTLEYEIKSVGVNMSGVSFNNIEVTYDGKSHRPELTGVLPLEITYVIDNSMECINAGVYTVKCTFASSDEGIIAPSPLYSIVTIHKKELTAVFSEPSNMIANGQKKSLTVDLDGVVSGEDVRYSLEYSNEPILAGEYTCRINLIDDDNYTLKSNAPYRFIIFMSTINYSDNGLNLSVDGKFSSRDNLTIGKINDKLEVVNLLSKMDIKGYLALNFSCVSFSSELMTVSVDSRDLAEKINYLKAYRIKNNQLEEIEYTIKDNVISFKSNCNEKIIFVESHNYIYAHRVEINSIIIFAIVSLAIMLVIAIINVKSKKRVKVTKQVK